MLLSIKESTLLIHNPIE